MRARILFVIYGTMFSEATKGMVHNRHYINIIGQKEGRKRGKMTVSITHHTELAFMFYLSASPFKLSCLWGASF